MISLIVPVYNMEAYLDRCMDTLLPQTCRDFEILLIDDGSRDKSAAMCDDYAAQFPELIRVVHKPNGGLSSARNAGIDAAKGEFIVFPDPDDWVTPDYISKFLTLQREFDADLVCTGYFVTDGSCSNAVCSDIAPAALTAAEARERLLLAPAMNGFAWNKLYRLSIIRANNLRFASDVGTTEDLEFAYRYLSHANRVCHAPCEHTYFYFQRPGAATHSSFARRKLDNLNTYLRLMTDESAVLRKAARDEACVCAVNLLWEWMCGDRTDREAKRILRRSIWRYLPAHLAANRHGMGRKAQAVAAAISPRLFYTLKTMARNNT